MSGTHIAYAAAREGCMGPAIVEGRYAAACPSIGLHARYVMPGTDIPVVLQIRDAMRHRQGVDCMVSYLAMRSAPYAIPGNDAAHGATSGPRTGCEAGVGPDEVARRGIMLRVRYALSGPGIGYTASKRARVRLYRATPALCNVRP
eukprot:1778704-Rhodomonas_salina.7